MEHVLERPRIVVDVLLADQEQRTLAEDVLDGLTRPFKELPPKLFYDARGSELFDAICELPEYYPTRVERAILEASAPEIARITGAVELVELGSGAATKARVLLGAMEPGEMPRHYVPVDVSETALRASADELVADFPDLEVHGLVGDFERHLDRLPQADPTRPRLVSFLGGTIGNFLPGSRRRFLRQLASVLAADGWLLLGTDLVKDERVLEAAYDDAAGVTAAFNRNVLNVLNRELDADFDPDAFDHVAFFDADTSWIEMRLRARRRQQVVIRQLGLTVHFAAREEVRTEISTKFTRARIEQDLAAAGLRLAGWFTDPGEMFALTLAQPLAARRAH
jgi:L-histidine N-alpha-methyltransferase